MIQRRKGRELTVKAIYAFEVSGNDKQQVFSSIVAPKFKQDKKNYDFVEDLFFKTLHHQSRFDEIIQQHIKNWKIERLAILDKVILRMALCEFLFFDEIPTKVTINEAIEIAKNYSTEKSGNFINGILDAALADLKKEGKINKTGRGLIESSVN